VRSVRRPQIGGDFFGFAAGMRNLGNDGRRFLLGAAVVNDYLSTGLPERQSGRAADAAGAT